VDYILAGDLVVHLLHRCRNRKPVIMDVSEDLLAQRLDDTEISGYVSYAPDGRLIVEY
jgi:hypothetical protein